MKKLKVLELFGGIGACSKALERLGIDYFDVFFVHNINVPWYKLAENAKTFEYVKKMKENGKAKKIGFSFHDNSKLLKEYDWNEISLQQIAIMKNLEQHKLR